MVGWLLSCHMAGFNLSAIFVYLFIFIYSLGFYLCLELALYTKMTRTLQERSASVVTPVIYPEL